MARNRNTETETQTDDTTVETKRAPRNPIDTSGVTFGGRVEDPSLGTRASKLDTDPVATAVRDAEQSVKGQEPNWYALMIDPAKVDGVKSIATRAAARFNVGINFDTRKVSEGVLYFKTGEKRKVNRKPKAAAEGAPVESTNAGE